MVPCITLYSMNKQQMQLYAVNFITLLGSLYMFRLQPLAQTIVSPQLLNPSVACRPRWE